MAPRRASGGRRERRTARRTVRLRRRLLVVAMVVAVVAVGGWKLTRSSLFELSGIDVVGARDVARERIVGASGLRLGQNMLGLNLDEVEQRIVALVPEVRSARAERDGTTHVRILVEARTPAVVTVGPTGRWLVDRDGRIIGPATDPRTALPVVRVASGATPVAGGAGAIADIWRAMRKDLASRVAWFDVPSLDEITFELGAATILFGGPGRVREKLEAIDLVMRRVAAEGKTLLRLDVRVPSRPAARVR